jgi:hypothetical protein
LDVGEWSRDAKNPCPYFRERQSVKRKPDVVLILAAAFALGVLVTLLLPLAANDSVAGPVSELQAGIILPQ